LGIFPDTSSVQEPGSNKRCLLFQTATAHLNQCLENDSECAPNLE
jgi:hypothetical protein